MAATTDRKRKHLHLLHRARHGNGHAWTEAQLDQHASKGIELDPAHLATPSTPQNPNRVEMVRRAASTCTDTTSQGCRTDNSAPPLGLAIGLGVWYDCFLLMPQLELIASSSIPIVLAFILFVILHRRHVKKLRREELDDPHKSLDFGMDASPAQAPKKGKKGKEMTTVTNQGLEQSLRRGRGVSLDIDMGSPYLLPPEIHNSRESLHSLSRNFSHNSHDPYLAANAETMSTRSQRMREDDHSSIRSGSTRQGQRQDGMHHNLLRNASRMSQSDRPFMASPDSMAHSSNTSPPPPAVSPPAGQAISLSSSHAIPRKQIALTSEDSSLAPPAPTLDPRASQQSSDMNALRKSNNYLGAFIQSREGSIVGGESSPTHSDPSSQHGSQAPPASGNYLDGPPTLPSISIESDVRDADPEPYDVASLVAPAADGELETPPELMPDASPHTDSSAFYTPTETPTASGVTGLGVSDVDFGSRPLSIVRPLPPEDPNDNAEQRANRIRSFYKEYFDDSAPARAYKAGSADYYEDYGQEYLGDGAIFDPASGKFLVTGARPYAEPVTRRAMTPPPRGPPRFQGPRRHGPNMSSGRMSAGAGGHPRSRAFSSASTSRMGPGMPGPRGRAPKRSMPPPSPLRTLPTPHLLKEDAFTLAIDFAPPTNFRDQQAGRPQSPFGEARPYSPSVPVATPLSSAFSELSAMPSP